MVARAACGRQSATTPETALEEAGEGDEEEEEEEVVGEERAGEEEGRTNTKEGTMNN